MTLGRLARERYSGAADHPYPLPGEKAKQLAEEQSPDPGAPKARDHRGEEDITFILPDLLRN